MENNRTPRTALHHSPPCDPIRTDSRNWFAHNTMSERFPRNLAAVLAVNNHFSPADRKRIEVLGRSITDNDLLPPPPLPAYDHEQWRRRRLPLRGERWLAAPWFFAETYAFRLLLEAARYFQTLQDPFAPLKQREIDSGAAFFALRRSSPTGNADREAQLASALHTALWGNRADISFAGGARPAVDAQPGESALVIDDTVAAVDALIKLRKRPRAAVHLITDNAGAELAGDLQLARTLVGVLGVRVTLHLKLYPTYVSDATVNDLQSLLHAATCAADPLIRSFGEDIATLIAEESIRVAPDDYWCGTEFLCDSPARIRAALRGAGLVIVKGDWNYRRVFRDTIWAETAPRLAMGLNQPGRVRFGTTPFLMLRTLKSDCLAGLAASAAAALDRAESRWRTGGTRGLIQLVEPYAAASV